MENAASGCGSSSMFWYNYAYTWPIDGWPPTALGTNIVTDSDGEDETNAGYGPPTTVMEEWAENDHQVFPEVVNTSGCLATLTVNYNNQTSSSMTLYTGGKGVAGRQNLFAINVSATAYANPVLTGELLIPAFYTTLAVPNSTIKVLGKSPGNDNIVWTVLPAGTTMDITPQATPPCYTYSIYPRQIPVTLAANGNDLSQTNPTFCVGQQITFGLNISATYVNAAVNWNLPVKYVNESWQKQQWVNGLEIPYGSVNYDIDNSLLSYTTSGGITTSCWYVNGTGGAASVVASLLFPNGQTASIAALGQFTIYRPTAKMVSIDEPRYFTITNNTGLTCTLQLGAANGDGSMTYHAEVDSTPVNSNPQFNGLADITQLVTLDYSDPYYICSGYCDGTRFYQATGHSAVAGSGPVNLIDGPSEIWDSPNIVNISAQDFILFQPYGNNSIWVTLGIVTWDAVGTAEQASTNVSWTLTTDVSPDPSGPDNSDTFPVWTQSITTH
jgi:hypothetical protein